MNASRRTTDALARGAAFLAFRLIAAVRLVAAIGLIALAIGCVRDVGTGALPPALPNGYRLPRGWSEEVRAVRVAEDGAVVGRNITYYVSPEPYRIAFVYVPDGSFVMGSPPDEEGRDEGEVRHRVIFREPLLVGATEITVAQYRALFPDEAMTADGARPDAPVTDATWRQAVRFARKLSGKLGTKLVCRLPTEAEWEYAARAGSSSAYAWGGEPNAEWFSSKASGPSGAVNVGGYPANAWGLFDMHGNAIEWCRDRYAPSQGARTRIDPIGPIGGALRVQRGGSYADAPLECRSASRRGADPETGRGGFRVVVHLPVPRIDDQYDTIKRPFSGIFGDD